MAEVPPSENKLRFIAIIQGKVFHRSFGQCDFSWKFYKRPRQKNPICRWVKLGIVATQEFSVLLFDLTKSLSLSFLNRNLSPDNLHQNNLGVYLQHTFSRPHHDLIESRSLHVNKYCR